MANFPNITEASLDLSTICQLRCKECSTAKGITHNSIIGRGQMSFRFFKSFIDNNPQIKRIEMSNWGEIFLNKDIASIIKYAFEHNVVLYCGNGTNFNDVDEEVLEYLVKYKVEFLNLSIDGATQETYDQYRVNGNLSKVLANIERLNYYKKQYNSVYPKLSWQFIIFGHNEHEIPQIKDMCRQYDMAFNPKLNYSEFSPVRNKVFVRQESGLGVATRQEYKDLYYKEYKAPCYHCFVSPQVNWDGQILGCSINKWKALGNIVNEDLLTWQKSEKFKQLVSVLFEGKPCDDSLPCYFCPNYNGKKGIPLTEKGLQSYLDYVPQALK